MAGGAIIAFAGVAAVWIAGNDSTGIGVIDDGLLAGVWSLFQKGLNLVGAGV